MSTRSPSTMPTFYIPHGGGPCFFMDWDPPELWRGMEAFLRALPAQLPARPRAVVVISAHWQAPQFTVTGAARHELLYDYYGFPPHTYQLRYPAPGSPELSQQVLHWIEEAGIEGALDTTRGLDHGVFIPLKVIFPEADLPVLALSLQQGRDSRAHLELGRSLRPLRDQGVLLLGSGMSFHNMRAYGQPAYEAASRTFDDWLTATMEGDPAARDRALLHWDQAPAARQAHPEGEDEHFTPLLVAAGAAEGGRGQRVYAEQLLYSHISAYRFD